jgi:hypothetical protein
MFAVGVILHELLTLHFSFHFKTNEEFVGGVLQIDGEKIADNMILERKMMQGFFESLLSSSLSSLLSSSLSSPSLCCPNSYPEESANMSEKKSSSSTKPFALPFHSCSLDLYFFYYYFFSGEELMTLHKFSLLTCFVCLLFRTDFMYMWRHSLP